jgi:hypothetical protein
LVLAILLATSLPVATDAPAWPATEEIREEGESPAYYQRPKPIVGIGLRPSVKGIARIDAGDRATMAFGADLHVVGRLGLGRGRRVLGLWPEAGYVYSGSEGHFASAGIGPALQTPTPWLQPIPDALSFGIVPHLLAGSRDGHGALGLRTSAIAEVYFDDGNAWGLEVAHQITRAADVTLHEITFGISLTWLGHRWQ